MSSDSNSQIKKAKTESVQQMSSSSILNEKKLKQMLQTSNRKQGPSQGQAEIKKIQDESERTSKKDDFQWDETIADSDNESDVKNIRSCTQNKQPSKESFEKKGVPNSELGVNSQASEWPLSQDNSNNRSCNSTSDEDDVPLEQKVCLLKHDKKELLKQLRAKNELFNKMLGDDMQKIADMKTKNIQLCQNNDKLNDEILHLKKKVKILETENIEYKEKLKIYNSKETPEERVALKDYEFYQQMCNISVKALNTIGNLYANWDNEANQLRKQFDEPKAQEANTDFGKPAGSILIKEEPFEFVDVKPEVPLDIATFDDSVLTAAKEITKNSFLQEDVTASSSTNTTERLFKPVKKLIHVLKLEETDITNYIASNKLRRLPHDDNEILTAALLRNLFTESDFANCSRTGKSGRNMETAKPQLDPYKQKAIYDYVKKQFPHISAGDVEKKITNTIEYRCKNASKNVPNAKKE